MTLAKNAGFGKAVKNIIAFFAAVITGAKYIPGYSVHKQHVMTLFVNNKHRVINLIKHTPLAQMPSGNAAVLRYANITLLSVVIAVNAVRRLTVRLGIIQCGIRLLKHDFKISAFTA